MSRRRILVGCSIVAAAIVIFGLSLSWNLSGPRLVLMLVPVVLFALTAVAVTNYTHGLWRFARQSSARTLGVLMLCLSVASGLNFAYSVTSTWASARERLESEQKRNHDKEGAHRKYPSSWPGCRTGK